MFLCVSATLRCALAVPAVTVLPSLLPASFLAHCTHTGRSSHSVVWQAVSVISPGVTGSECYFARCDRQWVLFRQVWQAVSVVLLGVTGSECCFARCDRQWVLFCQVWQAVSVVLPGVTSSECCFARCDRQWVLFCQVWQAVSVVLPVLWLAVV